MSRRAFREPVTSPRPRAALAMALLATATLAITGQIAAGALVAGVLAIGASLALREPPRPWQRSGWLLNAGLLAALGVGAALYARGALAVVALAHFAVLAQGLQLLDARPRRSEFLLVALALFQVVLAANLTDHVLFPLMLVAFTVATVWTLVVHTLRAEALEAGEPDAAPRAITRGLRSTVILASLLSVLLALVLFPVLPRIRTGAMLSAGLGSAVALSGFSDRVELGDLGRIRHDPQVVLRAQTLEGDGLAEAARYVRGLAFDHFDGRRWSVTPAGRTRVEGDAEIGVGLPAPRQGSRLVQRIAREPIEGGVLFAAGWPVGLRGALGRLERDAGGALYAHGTSFARVDYTVASRLVEPTDAELAADSAEPPPPGDARYLALPALSPAVAALAEEAVAGASGDAARARALERFLRERGRYTDHPTRHDPADPRSPLESFLTGEMAGHCEYFASAMTVLARSLGMPARIVNGFAGGSDNSVGGFTEFAQADAHAWVEIHFARAGWVRYDPTPPDLRLAGAAALRRAGGLAELASALELWWFRNVVDFDRGHQARAVRGLAERLRGWRRTDRGGARGAARPAGGLESVRLPFPAWVGLAGALAMGALLLALRPRRRRSGLPAPYASALRLLAALGLVREPATTARAFAAAAGGVLPPAAHEAFRALTEAYLRERFAGERDPGAEAALAALRDSLRR
jgi:protein-glutamine gamma-glutamyltransferase